MGFIFNACSVRIQPYRPVLELFFSFFRFVRSENLKVFHWHFYWIYFTVIPRYSLAIMSSQWTVPMNHLYKPYCCRYMHKSTDNTAHIHSFCHLQLTVFNTIQYHSISIHSIPFKEYNIDSQSSSILFFRLLTIDIHTLNCYTHFPVKLKQKKSIAHIGSKWMNLIFLKCNRHFSIQTVQRRKQNRNK